MGNFLRKLFKRLTTSKSKPNPFLRPPQLTYLEDRITPTTFTVNTNADSGTGSLRAAIDLANITAGDDIIDFNFASGTNPYTITLAGALPTIVSANTSVSGGTAGTLTITGPGASSLTISGNNGVSDRNFRIFNIASGGNLTISGVTVTGAKITGNGGGFNNSGTLTISNSTISGNTATGTGGGIRNNNGGIINLTNSLVSGNSASQDGGGILNPVGGTFTLANSTISSNSATRQGGGIVNGGTFTISNSTISSNSATTGGGIFINSGTLTITNTTIASNTATTSGGGINNLGTLNIANTIIANSTSGGDYAGNSNVNRISPATLANNLVSQGSFSWATTKTSAEINLGPLQNNGGPTFTMALGAGSAAIATGNATISNNPIYANGKDQRGINRTTSDIGAYSFGIQVTTTTTDNTTSPVSGSLRAAIDLANTTAGNDQISVNLTGANPYTINLAGALTNIIDANSVILDSNSQPIGTAGTVTITGLGASSLNISGDNGNAGRDFRIFNIASGGNLTISGVTVSGAKTSGNGGAFNNSGTLTVTNSTISGNSSALNGGGIDNRGTLNLINTTLSSNSAVFAGGGIFNFFGIGTITNSTFSSNSTGTAGGGIWNAGNLNLTNSTLSGNSATTNGGGIYNSANLTISNSTIASNSATTGGGIYNKGSAIINNTIIANSSGGSVDFVNGTNGTATATNTLLTSGTLSGATTTTSSLLKLGLLQNNGGPTFTMALGAGSVAIKTAAGTGTDQRGINRTTSDIGAYSFGIQVINTSDVNTVGSGSLRAAINLANNTPGNDQISFNLTGASTYTITLDSSNIPKSLPTILDATALINGAPRGTLTITGLGASSLIISGDNGDPNRNFNIFNIDTDGNLTISGVTVSGAQTRDDGGAFRVNDSTLSIFDSIISDNKARIGGGIYSTYGNVTVNKSTLSGNFAIRDDEFGGEGGGIANSDYGKLYVDNSTLTGNSATTNGGGIYNRSNGNITVTNSTIASNRADNGGGGIFNHGTFTVSNSTIATNTANNEGGGILSTGTGTGTGTVTNSTLSGNNSTTNDGGGIFNAGTLNLANTIIANSTSGGDFAGTAPNTNTNNLVEDGKVSGNTYAWTVTGDPRLGPLQNNGGPTFTMALGAGSPAIGAGNATISNASPINGKDQRGFARSTSDIGSYAYIAPTVQNNVVVAVNTSGQVGLFLSSAGTAITDFHTAFAGSTLTITAATTGTLLTAPSAGIAGISIINGSTDTITLDLNTLINFAGLVIVGNSGLDSVTIGTGGVDLSAVTTGAANQSFTANILGTSTSTSALALSNAIKTKGTAATYLSAGSINGTGLITTPSITLAALSGIGDTTMGTMGNPDGLQLATGLISADSTTGKISINNTLGTAVSVASLTSKGMVNPSGALITFRR